MELVHKKLIVFLNLPGTGNDFALDRVRNNYIIANLPGTGNDFAPYMVRKK